MGSFKWVHVIVHRPFLKLTFFYYCFNYVARKKQAWGPSNGEMLTILYLALGKIMWILSILLSGNLSIIFIFSGV